MYKVDTYFYESVDKYAKEEYTNTVVKIEYRGVEQLAARRAHNPKVVGSNPAPATRFKKFAKSELFSFLESNFFLVNSHLCLLVAKIKIRGTTNSFYLLSLNLFKN